MRKVLALLLLLVMIFSLPACRSTAQTPKNESLSGQQEQTADPSPQTEEKEVALYFVNNEYVQTGNEDLEKLIPEKRIIEYGTISLEEAVVRELLKGTESEELSTGIPSTVKLLGVEVTDSTAYVNFAAEGLNGGSFQEMMTIEQIIQTLTDLETVDSVQFLVDGEKAETLMGHMSIADPFTK
ncbi:MAG: GerMN domain-containing protein [Peptococcaceae bacterium]|nr:GerMN domain-containing protein [Peptococcaceae bacterium]